jgi:hypothetical protein
MFTVAWPAMAQKGRLKLYLLPPPEFAKFMSSPMML